MKSRRITYFISGINAKTLINLKERTERKCLTIILFHQRKILNHALFYENIKKMIFDASNSKVCIQMLRLSKPKGHRKERFFKVKGNDSF